MEAIYAHLPASSSEFQSFLSQSSTRSCMALLSLINYFEQASRVSFYLRQEGCYSRNPKNTPFDCLTTWEGRSFYPSLTDAAGAIRGARNVSLARKIPQEEGLLRILVVNDTRGSRDVLLHDAHDFSRGVPRVFPIRHALPILLKISCSSGYNKIIMFYFEDFVACLKTNFQPIVQSMLCYNQMIKFIYKSHHLSFVQISRFFASDLNKKPNLYALLQLKPGAKIEEIRYNYFKLMGKYKVDGAIQNEGLKHSKLLNQAFAILSNDKLREKYDNQNGYSGKDKQNQDKPQKLNMSGDSEMDKDYNEARRGFGAVLGDKKTRFQQKILGVAAVTMLIGTIALLVNGKGYKKQVLSKSAAQPKKE